MTELLSTCLLWLLFIWLGVNAALAVVLAVLWFTQKENRFDVFLDEKQEPALSKRTWATEMGLRLPK